MSLDEDRTAGHSRVTRALLLAALALLLAIGCTSVDGGAVDGGAVEGARSDRSAPAPGPSAPASADPLPEGATPGAATAPPAAPAQVADGVVAVEGLARLEEDAGARVGVYAVDTGSGRVVAHRADERFAYASTIKALAVGALLDSTDAADLDAVVAFTAEDLVTYSPITEGRTGTGMPLGEVVDAAVRFSDNTAANLILERLGGPEGLASALRAIGDDTTEPARIEPDLNDWAPGEVRDTSTPRAMATSLRAYALGDGLADPADRALLVDLLQRNTTGDDLIRAGAPDDWVVGDKTGTGAWGTRNDIAILWPPDRAPIVIAVMTSQDGPDDEPDDALVRDATALAIAALG